MASDGFYSFDSGVTLNAGQRYYFFEDQLVPSGTIGGGSFYSGGANYGSYGQNEPFLYGFQANNFAVTGTSTATAVAPTPEPSSLALLGTGVFGLLGVYRRRSVGLVAPVRMQH